MDQSSTIDEMKAWVRQFSRERNWEQFHHPKDLGVALVCEVGEVLEMFRYLSQDEIRERLRDPEQHRELAHELADCLWLILRLADVCDVDLAASLHEKLRLAAIKYPIDKAYGRADKYTAYQDRTDEP